MLWQASRFLLHRAPATALRWSRPFCVDITAETAEVSNFVDKRTKSVQSMDPPTTKLSVSLVITDNSILSSKEVDKVIIPTTKGRMDILPCNVATIAELKPGVLSVYEGKDIAKYFLCGGFAFVHSNNIADILAFDVLSHDNFQNLSNIFELCWRLTEINKAQDYHLIDRLIRLVLTLSVTTATIGVDFQL